eukprot:2670600-Rhodomonas_salina.1
MPVLAHARLVPPFRMRQHHTDTQPAFSTHTSAMMLRVRSRASDLQYQEDLSFQVRQVPYLVAKTQISTANRRSVPQIARDHRGDSTSSASAVVRIFLLLVAPVRHVSTGQSLGLQELEGVRCRVELCRLWSYAASVPSLSVAGA